MGYSSSRYSGRRGYGGAATANRSARWMELRYAGKCAQCKEALAAGDRAYYDPADRTVCCTSLVCAEAHGVTEERWMGSPTGGQYVTALASYRLAPRRGRCEDAPCCGCCS